MPQMIVRAVQQLEVGQLENAHRQTLQFVVDQVELLETGQMPFASRAVLFAGQVHGEAFRFRHTRFVCGRVEMIGRGVHFGVRFGQRLQAIL